MSVQEVLLQHPPYSHGSPCTVYTLKKEWLDYQATYLLDAVVRSPLYGVGVLDTDLQVTPAAFFPQDSQRADKSDVLNTTYY